MTDYPCCPAHGLAHPCETCAAELPAPSATIEITDLPDGGLNIRLAFVPCHDPDSRAQDIAAGLVELLRRASMREIGGDA